jgi:hypothetical protein
MATEVINHDTTHGMGAHCLRCLGYGRVLGKCYDAPLGEKLDGNHVSSACQDGATDASVACGGESSWVWRPKKATLTEVPEEKDGREPSELAA